MLRGRYGIFWAVVAWLALALSIAGIFYGAIQLSALIGRAG